jgi:hypothetical protein
VYQKLSWLTTQLSIVLDAIYNDLLKRKDKIYYRLSLMPKPTNFLVVVAGGVLVGMQSTSHGSQCSPDSLERKIPKILRRKKMPIMFVRVTLQRNPTSAAHCCLHLFLAALVTSNLVHSQVTLSEGAHHLKNHHMHFAFDLKSPTRSNHY